MNVKWAVKNRTTHDTGTKHVATDRQIAWVEVMKLAEQYGFIRFAYGGFAMLSIDEEAIKTK